MAPAWMRWVLYLAGAYNLLWGAFAVLMPEVSFRWGGLHTPGHAGLAPELYLPLWQCIGMVVGVYGIGYMIAGTDPYRHWPVILVGFLGKFFGPIGALAGAIQGKLPWSIVWTNIPNDYVWLPFFAVILYQARLNILREGPAPGLQAAMADARSSKGATLAALAITAPTLVVFLRHFG